MQRTKQAQMAIDVAIALGVISKFEQGVWFYVGERRGKYAFVNRRTNEWRFA